MPYNLWWKIKSNLLGIFFKKKLVSSGNFMLHIGFDALFSSYLTIRKTKVSVEDLVNKHVISHWLFSIANNIVM